MKLRFSIRYFLLTLLLFASEVFIALEVNDDVIRPYVGDILVVMLIYCFLRTFLKIPVQKAAWSVLTFSFLIEFLQFLNIISVLKLEKSALARTVIGHSYSVIDLLMYVIGFALILVIESFPKKS